MAATGQAGSSSNSRKRKISPPSSTAAVDDEGETEEEADMEELERELADLDRRVLEHRRRTAKRVLDSAASHIAALRPPAVLGTPPRIPPCSSARVLDWFGPVVWG
jgi:hypothetical protein